MSSSVPTRRSPTHVVETFAALEASLFAAEPDRSTSLATAYTRSFRPPVATPLRRIPALPDPPPSASAEFTPRSFPAWNALVAHLERKRPALSSSSAA